MWRRPGAHALLHHHRAAGICSRCRLGPIGGRRRAAPPSWPGAADRPVRLVGLGARTPSAGLHRCLRCSPFASGAPPLQGPSALHSPHPRALDLESKAEQPPTPTQVRPGACNPTSVLKRARSWGPRACSRRGAVWVRANLGGGAAGPATAQLQHPMASGAHLNAANPPLHPTPRRPTWCDPP